MHVRFHGKCLLLVLDFEQNWNELKDFSDYKNTKLHEYTYRISLDFT